MSAPTFAQSRLIVGTVQWGMPYGAANATGVPDDDTVAAMLDVAADAGISHLDTAAAYGDAERRVATGLEATRVAMGVITKVRPLAEGAGVDEVRASVAASLANLAPRPIDALLTHRAVDWLRPGVADVLDGLVREGTVRAVGASVSTPLEALAVLADPRLGYLQLPFNLLDRRWCRPQLVAALRARPDVVVTVRSVYLQGLLVAGTTAAWPASYRDRAAGLIALIDRLVAELGRRSRADLCLAYVRAHPWVSSVVVGGETVAQVRDTAELVALAPLDEAALAVVDRALPALPVGLLDPSRWR